MKIETYCYTFRFICLFLISNFLKSRTRNLIMAFERNSTLDVAKGITILLMPLSHLDFITKHQEFTAFNHSYLFIFKIPLFIIISGYLLTGQLKLSEYISRKCDSLLKPILTITLTTLIILFISQLLKGIHTIDINIFKMKMLFMSLYYPLWFIFTLFLSLTIFRSFILIDKLTKEHIYFWLVIITLLLLTINLFPVLQYHKYLIRPITLIPYFIVYLWIGYSIKKYNFIEKIISKSSAIISASICLLYVLFRDFLTIRINFWENHFEPLIPAIILSLCSTIVILNISKWLTKFNYASKLFYICSRNSLFILAFHILIGNYFVSPILLQFTNLGIITDIIGFIATILLCITLSHMVSKIRYLNRAIFPVKSLNLKIANK